MNPICIIISGLVITSTIKINFIAPFRFVNVLFGELGSVCKKSLSAYYTWIFQGSKKQ